MRKACQSQFVAIFSCEERSEIAFFRNDDGKTGGMSPAQCLCEIYAPAWIGVSFENEMLPVSQSFSDSIFLMNLAGFPPTTVIGGTSRVTTLLILCVIIYLPG